MALKRCNHETWWNLNLNCMPDFFKAMERVYAWYEGEVIDRAPVKFSLHNSEFSKINQDEKHWNTLKDKWVDVEYQVESFIKSIENTKYIAETFSVYWPNLGPSAYAAFHGLKLHFAEITSWSEHILNDLNDASSLKLDWENEYFQKIVQLTDYALKRCEGRFMVGYTDLHPGVDCVADWRDPQKLCMDFYDDPEGVKAAIEKSMEEFQKVYDFFDSKLKRQEQLSVTWMGIPSFGKMHIPSCDFSSMISPGHFAEYCLPLIRKEVKQMMHNIFHLDGKGVARHLDAILEIPEIQAIQWVQGEGEDSSIMKWIPLIKKIRAKGKSVVINLCKTELEDFIQEIGPEGIFLCVNADSMEEQHAILKTVYKWK